MTGKAIPSPTPPTWPPGVPPWPRSASKPFRRPFATWTLVDGDAAKLLMGSAFEGGKQSIHGLLPSQRDGVLGEAGSTVRANNAGCQKGGEKSNHKQTVAPHTPVSPGVDDHTRL